ncbi:hypothetical protein JCM3765_001055 [Sporobolomyces pararoseus]
MPPKRIDSIDLGQPTPSSGGGNGTQDNDGEFLDQDKILKLIEKDQERRRKKIEKQQKQVLRQTNQASKKYKETVEKILNQGELKMNETMKKHQIEEEKLKLELFKTEKELMKLLKIEASDTKLVTAAAMGAIEESEQARARLIQTLESIQTEQNTQGQAALDDLWVTDQEYDDEEERIDSRNDQYDDYDDNDDNLRRRRREVSA